MSEPLTEDELAALRSITTPTVANAIEAFQVRPRSEGFMDSTIRCIFPELGAIAGYAVTAKIAAREQPEAPLPPWEMWETMARVPKPWVVVIKRLSTQHALVCMRPQWLNSSGLGPGSLTIASNSGANCWANKSSTEQCGSNDQ